MRKYLVTIALPGGTRCRWLGLYASDWQAIDAALASHPLARSICPRRLS
ncbi:MAG: hypothetical protein ACKVOO_12515 [Burkholderiaceae bacterium]